ncbi:MAG: hypothetical protein B6D55_05375 [Candidatus Omnitrophica bacterium 4484_70.2]|nr:MAG: hypothetical protein B6D55_05375 [Candidatus Omnitrophica bacterium 4484_70.2]
MKKTQIILIALFFLFIISVFMFILYNMWESEEKTLILEKAIEDAYWAAFAGLEEGKIQALSGSVGVGSGSLSSNLRYSFTISTIPGFPDRRRISATGGYFDNAGNLIAQKRLRVDIQGIGDGISGNESTVQGSFYQIN